nr:spore cortex-lytic enzyme [Paenactinomyces guangxiensis]
MAAFQLKGTSHYHAFGPGILKIGARGGDVYELQGRLKFLGFYTGKVDGIFSTRTNNAVRLFQYRFGMKVDGLVGPKTKLKLWKATKNWRPGVRPKGLTLKKGARGGDVADLQGRLKFIGFYTGKTDGVFGNRTYRAVRLFQYEFGLKIDGIAGPETLTKLRAATKKYRPPQPQARRAPARVPKSSHGFSQNDLRLFAQAVHSESRGEPYIGQVAVAAVILNRIESEKFPNTISGVVFQPLAFEAVADGQIWLEPSESAKKAVMDALNGWDPSGGALYYFNPARATSNWIWNRPQIKRIGKHIFTR